MEKFECPLDLSVRSAVETEGSFEWNVDAHPREQLGESKSAHSKY